MLLASLIGALPRSCGLGRVTPMKVEIEAAVDEAGGAVEEAEDEEVEVAVEVGGVGNLAHISSEKVITSLVDK